MKRNAWITAAFAGIVAGMCFILFPLGASACGSERWPVKVVQDKHRKYFYKDRTISNGELVDPIATTVAKLWKEPWPFNYPVGKQPELWTFKQRNGQAEFTLWVVTATLLKMKTEDDEDYHLVLKSGTKKMIAEIPSENCVGSTPEPINSMIIQARADFDAWFDQQPDKNNLNTRVKITGMGFFDRVHGNAEGQVKKNGIEIHPVILIEFLN